MRPKAFRGGYESAGFYRVVKFAGLMHDVLPGVDTGYTVCWRDWQAHQGDVNLSNGIDTVATCLWCAAALVR